MSNVFTSVLSSGGGSGPVLDGDAVESEVLSGKTFYSDDAYTKQIGTMMNNGAVSQSLNCGGSYTVPEGYHNGSGTVTANSLASQTGVDSGKTAIDANHVHSGYQGWVNGSKVSGTYTEPTITSITPSDSSPVSMSANSNYKPSLNGYAIQSYTSISQSQLDAGVYFSSGMKKMSSAGYAYSSKPQMSETILWTNPNPAKTFAGQDITLSQSIQNFTYLGIYFAANYKNLTPEYWLMCRVSDVILMTSGGNCKYPLQGLPNAVRTWYYKSDTVLHINIHYALNAVAQGNVSTIPLRVVGISL